MRKFSIKQIVENKKSDQGMCNSGKKDQKDQSDSDKRR